MEKTVVWYSIRNGGDGSASTDWFLSREEAEWDQENMYEAWGEDCSGSVETFVGSDIYNDGLKNREQNQKLYKAKHTNIKLPKGEYDDAFKAIELTEEEKQSIDFIQERPIRGWALNCK